MADRNRHLTARANSGFTLIELLIVVAIIAALIAIIVPVIGALRDKARAAATQQRMSTIATAIEQYKTDLYAYPSSTPGTTAGYAGVNSGSAMLCQALIGYLGGDADGAGSSKADPSELGFRLAPGGVGRIYGPYTDQNAGIQPQSGRYGTIRVDNPSRAVYLDSYGNEILYYRSTGILNPTEIFGDGTTSIFVGSDNSVVSNADGTPSGSPAAGTVKFFQSMGATGNSSNVASTFGRASYVLISANRDGVYFNNDDVTAPTR